MSGRILRGPWRPRPCRPGPEAVPFAQLDQADQIALLDFAILDTRRYWSDLAPGERWWLLDQLPSVRPLRAAALPARERCQLADALLLVLRRRAGWAA